jgi:hypothetical protein
MSESRVEIVEVGVLSNEESKNEVSEAMMRVRDCGGSGAM